MDTNTSNYFLNLFNNLCALSLMNKNNKTILKLYDESLEGIDPYDPNLTTKTKCKIIKECQKNIWYFFREVLRIKGPNTDFAKINPTPNNIAQIYCASNNKSYLNNDVRESLKNTISNCLAIYYANFYNQNSIYLNPHSKEQNCTVKKLYYNIKIPDYMNFGYEENIKVYSIEKYAHICEDKEQKFIIIPDYEFIKSIDEIIRYLRSYNKEIIILASSCYCNYAKSNGVFNILEKCKEFTFKDFYKDSINNNIFHIQYDFGLLMNDEEQKKYIEYWLKIFDNNMSALKNEILLIRREGR